MLTPRRKLNFLLNERIVLVGLSLLLALVTGIVVAEGRIRTMGLILALTAIPFVLRMNERNRFRLLIATVLLVPLQMPRIPWTSIPVPFGASLSELILLSLAGVQLLTRQDSARCSSNRKISSAQYLPYIAFAFTGLISALRNGELHIWHIVSLVPLLAIFVADHLIQTSVDALRLMQAALIAILGYLFVYWLANQIGSTIEVYGPELQWRQGAKFVTLGPIQYFSYSITFGTLLALGMPFVTLQILRTERPFAYRLVYGTIFAVFVAVLALTSARGATIGAVVGMSLVLILSGRLRSPRMVAALVILAIALSVLVPYLIRRSPALEASRARWMGTNWNAFREEPNFQSRFETLRFTLENAGENPLGYGYDYLWANYHIDESIVYSALLNGAGWGGAASFVFIVGYLLWRYIISIWRGNTGPKRDLAIIGLGTLVCGLIAGVSTESVLLGAVQSFVFWTIIVAAWCGIRS